MVHILYEDNHLVAVWKPAGVLTQGDISGKTNLMDEVKKYLKEKYKKPGNVFLGLLHRLDKPVSGIILFAKTSKGASRLSEQFRNREIEKIYHAVVTGKIEPAKGAIVNYIKKDEANKKAIISESGQKAELFYEVISTNNKYSLLRIKLGTGRFHQIRAQLAFAGFPVLGDLKYGSSAAMLGKAIALCATSLTFKLAVGNAKKKIEIPVPANWAEYLQG